MSKLDDLTPRELWQNIMRYRTGEFDRMPVIHWNCWDETFERWWSEGLPRDINRRDVPAQQAYFNTHAQWSGVGLNLNLHPGFEPKLVEETDEYTISWSREGVLLKDLKHAGSIPHFMDWAFKTADDWPRYKEHLQISAERIPDDLDGKIAQAESSGLPVVISVASMMGWIRNWMGVENMVYLMFDSPDCYADIVETMSDLVCWSIDQIVPRMSAPPDLAHGWEDIAGSSGPFVNPDQFDRLVAPGYKKIRAKLEEHGVDIYSIDSDGKVEPLIANWLAAGVNMQSRSNRAPGIARRRRCGPSSARSCSSWAASTSSPWNAAATRSTPRSRGTSR
jgi:hypothetical protein